MLSWIRLRLRKYRSVQDPAEILTDAFTQVYRARRSFKDRGPGSFTGWFLKIADNQILQNHRQARRRDRREQQSARSIYDDSTDPFLCAVNNENQMFSECTYLQLRTLVQEGLRRLHPRHEQVLRLHAVHGLTYEEISRALGISPGAVTMRVKRGRDSILRHVVLSLQSSKGESP